MQVSFIIYILVYRGRKGGEGRMGEVKACICDGCLCNTCMLDSDDCPKNLACSSCSMTMASCVKECSEYIDDSEVVEYYYEDPDVDFEDDESW